MMIGKQTKMRHARRSPGTTTSESRPALLSRRALVAAGCGLAGAYFLPASAHASEIQATPAPGRLIVTQLSLPSGENGIFVANTDFSDPRLLAGSSGNSATHPDWSPDGSQIVY